MNMSAVKVSVVVPMYNTADYLEKCLDSLISQSLKNIEIILVNDGSADDTLSIAKRYEKEDKRIKLINKKNTGYGDSVNKGIEIAVGKYVGIVEPDDYCSDKMFEELFNLAEQYDADIARGNYYHFSKNGLQKMESTYMKSKGGIVKPLQDYGLFYEPPAIWSAIYRKVFLKKNEIVFLDTPGASYQDAGFHFKTLACVNCMVYTDKPLYYYRVDNPNSSVKSYKKTMAIVREYESIEDFIKKLNDNELLIKYCQVAKFGRYHWNLLRVNKRDAKRFAKLMKEEFKEKKKAGLIEKEFFPKKYWLSLKALMILPIGLYLFVFSIKKRIR